MIDIGRLYRFGKNEDGQLGAGELGRDTPERSDVLLEVTLP